ncbi:MAG TPA: 4-hydroxy-3-methylbut-2-enyl diphosphate reductase [Elusimicrobiota bacterium]|nr:4-hydroxy-3-methylbut-2-enyl diphosphate reductase [Elusimicrobiota bacterium]
MVETPTKVKIDKLVLAKLRGFCAGVVRAIDVVEKALDICGKPVYVRHEIIHNRYVVDELRAKGAVFVEDLKEVPAGSWLVFSAHGVAPQVEQEAKDRKLKIIDATCPLVTKVHLEAIALAKRGFSIILIGHAEHVEAIGTMGEAPEHIQIVGTPEEALTVQVKDPAKVAYLTQTTLSLDDTKQIVEVLKKRFPNLRQPAKDDICYATQNRQNAVKAMVPRVDLLLVLGAPNSSNSLRLCEVARGQGVNSHLIERASGIKEEWLAGVHTLGLTASASAPEILVQETVKYCRDHFGVTQVEEFETVEEDMHFALPYELEQIIKKGN